MGMRSIPQVTVIDPEVAAKLFGAAMAESGSP
jgi:hypothetical protein